MKYPTASKTDSYAETPTPSVKSCSRDSDMYAINKPVIEANPCQEENQAKDSEEEPDTVDQDSIKKTPIGILKKKPKIDPVHFTSSCSNKSDLYPTRGKH